MTLYQLYAIVPAAEWTDPILGRWPEAPLIKGYRLLVFTNKDLEAVKNILSSPEISNEKTIILKRMREGTLNTTITDHSTIRAIIEGLLPKMEVQE